MYEVNYGYIKGVKVADGDDLDAYYLGINTPIEKAHGTCIAIIHRTNDDDDDDDDKLIIVPNSIQMTDEEILKSVDFQEKWFKTIILRH